MVVIMLLQKLSYNLYHRYSSNIIYFKTMQNFNALITRGRFKGVLDPLTLNFKNTKVACTANEISLTADFQSLSLA